MQRTNDGYLQQQPQQHACKLRVALAAVLRQVLPRHQPQLTGQVLKGKALEDEGG